MLLKNILILIIILIKSKLVIMFDMGHKVNVTFIINSPTCQCNQTYEKLIENSMKWLHNQSQFSKIFESYFHTIIYRTCTDQQFTSLLMDESNQNVIEPNFLNSFDIIHATNAFLQYLNWTLNLDFVISDKNFLQQIFYIQRTHNLCISKIMTFQEFHRLNIIDKNSPIVLIGNWKELTLAAYYLNNNFYFKTFFALFVTVDGYITENVSNNSYYIDTLSIDEYDSMNIFNPILLKIIESLLKINNYKKQYKNKDIVKRFQLTSKRDHFIFSLKKNGQTIQTYNIITQKLSNSSESDLENIHNLNYSFQKSYCIIIKSDQNWIWIVLSFSSLGFSISFIILLYILKKICQKSILEGNPILTILLLLHTCIMYLAVVPFILDCPLCCIWKIFTFGFSFNVILSLILARLVFLKTLSNINTSLHIPGFILSILAFFIFAVAISLISFSSVYLCDNIFYAFEIIIIYDSFLILLILSLCPFVYKNRRNYNEAFYFSIFSVFLFVNWMLWVYGFFQLSSEWSEPILCYGLLSTASLLLCIVFIPRTYLINSSEIRELVLASTLTESVSKLGVHEGNLCDAPYVIANNSTNL